MRAGIVAAAAGLAAVLGGCGASPDAPAALSAARDPGAGARGSAASLPLFTAPPPVPMRQNINLSQPIHMAMSCDHDGESLAHLVATARRGAAVASVLAIGPAMWNTPGGARPTQAEVDTPRTTQLAIYTTYRLRIGRVLHAYAGLSADETITADLLGGEVGNDFLQNGCGPNPMPHVGWSAVVLFGDEFPTPAAAGAPLHRPVIDQLDVIQGGQAYTWQGPQPVPAPQ